MKLSEIPQVLANSNIVGLIEKSTGKKFMRGDNPYYDMQIDNLILCPADCENYYGFIRDDYEPVYK